MDKKVTRGQWLALMGAMLDETREFDLTVPEDAYAVPGTWRAVWVGPGGAIRVSRDVSYPG